MSGLKLIRFDSIDCLRSRAAEWDDLWQRSDVSLPSGRAELLADWVEHFMPRAKFTALAVEDRGRLIAAIPLVDRRLVPFLKFGGMPSNPWEACGDLFVDATADSSAALDLLVSEFDRLDWPLLWLSWLRPNSARWFALRAALTRAGLDYEIVPHCRLGVLDLNGDWEHYLAGRSSKLRSQLRRVSKRLAEDGGCEAFFHSTFDHGEVAELVRRGFEVEDRSWKGAAGTSVLKTPGMLEYITRRAQLMADRGHLELAFLEHRGQPIAFAFAFAAKGTYHAMKIGYDDAFARYSPGVILRSHLIQRLFREPEWRLVQFNGQVTDQATRRWSTGSEVVGRVVIAPRRLAGRTTLWAYRHWRALRNRPTMEVSEGSEPFDDTGKADVEGAPTPTDEKLPTITAGAPLIEPSPIVDQPPSLL